MAFITFFLVVLNPAVSIDGSMISRAFLSSTSSSGKKRHCSKASFMHMAFTLMGSATDIMCSMQKSRKSVRTVSSWNGCRSSRVSRSLLLESLFVDMVHFVDDELDFIVWVVLFFFDMNYDCVCSYYQLIYING